MKTLSVYYAPRVDRFAGTPRYEGQYIFIPEQNILIGYFETFPIIVTSGEVLENIKTVAADKNFYSCPEVMLPGGERVGLIHKKDVEDQDVLKLVEIMKQLESRGIEAVKEFDDMFSCSVLGYSCRKKTNQNTANP